MLQLTKVNKSRSNSEAVTGHRTKYTSASNPTGAICKHPFVETNQTAHISLQISIISNSVETKTNRMRPNLLARPPVNTSKISPSRLRQR
ncbi:hypothetical protein Q4577_23460, partial [Marinovum sp. 2_MG-2023]|nr:hypothetical protein [Marinovum sp. 2_MG-2023]MDO6782242.1 hypothetical protein [Marinovum sp. 1_MG-2023]